VNTDRQTHTYTHTDLRLISTDGVWPAKAYYLSINVVPTLPIDSLVLCSIRKNTYNKNIILATRIALLLGIKTISVCEYLCMCECVCVSVYVRVLYI